MKKQQDPFTAACRLFERQKWRPAQAAFERYLATTPAAARASAAHYKLGRIAEALQDDAAAGKSYLNGVKADPSNAANFSGFGFLYSRAGDYRRAKQCFDKAISLGCRDYDVFRQAARLAVAFNLEDDALRYAKAMMELKEMRDADAIYIAAYVAKIRLKNDQVAPLCERALALDPNHSGALALLAKLYFTTSDYEKAFALCERGIAAAPAENDFYATKAGMLNRLGRQQEALELVLKAIDLAPTPQRRAALYSGYLMQLNYSDALTPEEVLRRHLAFGAFFANVRKAPPYKHTPSLQPRRLRIGYISPNFHQHSVAYFFFGLLKYRDRERFEAFCYSLGAYHDEVTDQIKAAADGWRDLRSFSAREAAGQIHADKIDILVELAGHTAENALAILALKPAPVQASYIGYPNTTGLAEIDYRLTDAYCDPVGLTDAYHCEKLLRLPGSFLAYMPPSVAPAPAAAPPVQKNGYITFASFNNFSKIGDGVLRLWKEILDQTPGSKLLLKDKLLSCGYCRKEIIARLRAIGIDGAQVDLHAYEPSTSGHLELYRGVDIALDTFPYNGTTTTLEALYMGVPVVALAGKVHAARVGCSILANLGLADLAAATPDEYVERAVMLARLPGFLQHVRDGLRARLQASPLMQPKEHAGRVESAYLQMYRRYVWETRRK